VVSGDIERGNKLGNGRGRRYGAVVATHPKQSRSGITLDSLADPEKCAHMLSR
jgi:hypothetical protein